MSPLDAFLACYATLTADNLEMLSQVYSNDVYFCDPAHEINGIDELKRYFSEMYRNADEVRFAFNEQREIGDEAYIHWLMSLRHPRLAGGRVIEVVGLSHLRFNASGKVWYHRDFFDLGAMLYEHLPLVGSIIKTIKRRLGR